MNSEHPERQTDTSTSNAPQALVIPRWAIITVLLILSLPLLMMSSMMLTMGWMGPPMQGGMTGVDPDLFRVVGFIPLLLGIGILYGVYRLYETNKK